MTAPTMTMPALPELRAIIQRVFGAEHATDGLSRLLEPQCGTTKTGADVVLTLTRAIADYVEGVPPSVAAPMAFLFPDLLAAICAGHPEVLAEAAAFLRDVGKPEALPRDTRVAWHSKHTGACGHGQWLARASAQAALKIAVRDHGDDLDHWLEHRTIGDVTAEPED